MQESRTNTRAMLARGLLLDRWSCSTIARTSPFAHRDPCFLRERERGEPAAGFASIARVLTFGPQLNRATVLDPEAPAASGPLGSWIIVSAQRFTEWLNR